MCENYWFQMLRERLVVMLDVTLKCLPVLKSQNIEKIPSSTSALFVCVCT